MNKKFSEIDTEKPASFKQSWAVAYHFAEILNESYPEFSKKKLANIINGTIYYYHKEKGETLNHGMVQRHLKANSFPHSYKKALEKYLKGDDGDNNPLSSMMEEDAKRK